MTETAFTDRLPALRRLRVMLTDMGGMVESQLAMAVRAVVERDEAEAAAAMRSDPAVDRLEQDIEHYAVGLMTAQKLAAHDLRDVLAALKITGDLERIGDYAANLAKRSLVLNGFALPFSLSGFGHMARMVQENLQLTIDAIGEADKEKAATVWRTDLAVDDLYTALFRELMTYMMEDPRQITPCTHLLFMAKNLERIGDHATNIAERVHQAVTGEPIAGTRPKADQTSSPGNQNLGNQSVGNQSLGNETSGNDSSGNDSASAVTR